MDIHHLHRNNLKTLIASMIITYGHSQTLQLQLKGIHHLYSNNLRTLISTEKLKDAHCLYSHNLSAFINSTVTT